MIIPMIYPHVLQSMKMRSTGAASCKKNPEDNNLVFLPKFSSINEEIYIMFSIKFGTNIIFFSPHFNDFRKFISINGWNFKIQPHEKIRNNPSSNTQVACLIGRPS